MYIPFAYRTSFSDGTGSFNSNVLVVGAGGSGGVQAGGGGGGGQVTEGAIELTTATTYSIDVGDGARSDEYRDESPACTQWTLRRDTTPNPVVEYTNCLTGETESVTLSSLIDRRVFSTTTPVKISGGNAVITRGPFVYDYTRNPDKRTVITDEFEELVGFTGPIQFAQFINPSGNFQTQAFGYAGSPISFSYLSGSLVYTSMSNSSLTNISSTGSQFSSSYTASTSSLQGGTLIPVSIVSVGGGNGESNVYGASTAGSSGGGGGRYIGSGNVGSQGNDGGDALIITESFTGPCEQYRFQAGGNGSTASYEPCDETGSIDTILNENEFIVVCINSGSAKGITGANSAITYIQDCSGSFLTGSSGGGGGVGAIGADGTISSAGNGGNGISWIDGNYYGGGGAGIYIQSGSGSSGIGGLGGGGNANQSGSLNTGGGGGGSYTSASFGGSGVVIIRYAGPSVLATGGVITQSGSFVYHTFTSSAEFITTGSL